MTSKENTPFSTLYQDFYFSKAGGLKECEHVFLNPNRISERLQNESLVRIAELGFGTGLNFFSTWKLIAEKDQGSSFYFSVDETILKKNDRSKLQVQFPELSEYIELFEHLLLDNPFTTGWNKFTVHSKLTLYLFWGDVLNFLRTLPDLESMAQEKINAWFLDGFAPSRNPAMWSEAVLAGVDYHSKFGTTFGTYTSASEVRKTLVKFGFKVEKIKGFAGKRESLIGLKDA